MIWPALGSKYEDVVDAVQFSQTEHVVMASQVNLVPGTATIRRRR